MAKFSNILIILIILIIFGCVNSKKETDVLVFEPHIKKYMDIYINDNEELNIEKHVVIIQYVPISENEYAISIICELPVNIDFSIANAKDPIYFGYYKKFRVFVIDDTHKILRSAYKNIAPLKQLYSSEIIPISYDGMFWYLKIKDRKIIDFSYQYCQPNVNVFEQLKSISIPQSRKSATCD